MDTDIFSLVGSLKESEISHPPIHLAIRLLLLDVYVLKTNEKTYTVASEAFETQKRVPTVSEILQYLPASSPLTSMLLGYTILRMRKRDVTFAKGMRGTTPTLYLRLDENNIYPPGCTEIRHLYRVKNNDGIFVAINYPKMVDVIDGDKVILPMIEACMKPGSDFAWIIENSNFDNKDALRLAVLREKIMIALDRILRTYPL